MSAKIVKAAEIVQQVPVSTFTNENIVYLMGLSFMIGSLFTILLLILLDFMQRNNPNR